MLDFIIFPPLRGVEYSKTNSGETMHFLHGIIENFLNLQLSVTFSLMGSRGLMSPLQSEKGVRAFKNQFFLIFSRGNLFRIRVNGEVVALKNARRMGIKISPLKKIFKHEKTDFYSITCKALISQVVFMFIYRDYHYLHFILYLLTLNFASFLYPTQN